MTTLNEVRVYTHRVITALHIAGWDRAAFQLGDKLHGIGYQPLPKAYLMVMEEAERLAAQLLASGCASPVRVNR